MSVSGPFRVLQLVHQFAQRRARRLELHVLAGVANRMAGDHVSIEDEPFDPRAIDRLRMDLHDCHAPPSGPRPITGITATIVVATTRLPTGNAGGNGASREVFPLNGPALRTLPG